MRRARPIILAVLLMSTVLPAHAQLANGTYFRLGMGGTTYVAAPGHEDLAVAMADVDALRVGEAAFVPVTMTGTPTGTPVVTGIPGLSYDAGSHAITGVPTTANPSATLVISITDGTSTASDQATVEVADELATPPIVGSNNIVYDPYEPINIVVGNPGTVGNPIWTGINLPTGIVVNPSTGNVTGTPPSTPGDYTFELEVEDDWDGSTVRTDPITITVPTATELLAIRADDWADVIVASIAAMKRMDQNGVSLATNVHLWMFQNNRIPSVAIYTAPSTITMRASPVDPTAILLSSSRTTGQNATGLNRHFSRPECLALVDALTGRLPTDVNMPTCSPTTTLLLFYDYKP